MPHVIGCISYADKFVTRSDILMTLSFQEPVSTICKNDAAILKETLYCFYIRQPLLAHTELCKSPRTFRNHADVLFANLRNIHRHIGKLTKITPRSNPSISSLVGEIWPQ